MELTAALRGFQALKRPCFVVVHSDSEYVIKAFTHGWIRGWVRKQWRGVKNVELWQELVSASKPHAVRWEWVKGHAKVRLNERCDVMAKRARQSVEQAVRQGSPMYTLDFEVTGEPDGQLEFGDKLDLRLVRDG